MSIISTILRFLKRFSSVSYKPATIVSAFAVSSFHSHLSGHHCHHHSR